MRRQTTVKSMAFRGLACDFRLAVGISVILPDYSTVSVRLAVRESEPELAVTVSV